MIGRALAISEREDDLGLINRNNINHDGNCGKPLAIGVIGACEEF